MRGETCYSHILPEIQKVEDLVLNRLFTVAEAARKIGISPKAVYAYRGTKKRLDKKRPIITGAQPLRQRFLEGRNSRGNRNYDDDLKREVIDFVVATESVQEAADKYDISSTTLYKWFRDLEPVLSERIIGKKKVVPHVQEEKAKEIRKDFFDLGLSIRALSKKHGVSQSTVSSIIRAERLRRQGFSEGITHCTGRIVSPESLLKEELEAQEKINTEIAAENRGESYIGFSELKKRFCDEILGEVNTILATVSETMNSVLNDHFSMLVEKVSNKIDSQV